MSLDLIATVYGETPQGGTVESPVPLTGVSSFKVDSNTITLPIPRPLRRVGYVRDVCRTRVKSVYDKRIVLDGTEYWFISKGVFFYKSAVTDNALTMAACDRYKFHITDNGVSGVTTDKTFAFNIDTPERIMIRDDDYTSIAEFKAHLTDNPLTVYYQSTAYDGTNGLDVCLMKYQTGYIESYADESITTAWISSTGALSTGVEVAYVLSSPETYATDPVDIFVETIFPIVVFVGPITYKVVAHMHPFKTDWKVQPKTPEGYYNGDWFEIEDYNHILDNYQTIYKIAKALYPDLQIPTFVSPTLGAPTKASEINTIERTIDAFKTLTIALSDVGATKTWLDNGNLFNFEDINRWEQVALSYYTVFLGQVELLPKLQFKLGGAQF